jgi:Tfp pilus assembly protein PilO
MLQATPVPPLPPVMEFPTPPPWVTLPPAVVLIAFIAFCAVAGLVLWPLVHALAHRLEGRPQGADPELRAELEEMRARLAEVEGGQQRLAEVEERLDFAERLLTQRKDGAVLPRGE